MSGAHRTGVAVVGAGVLGCLITREILAADPGAQVTVLDRDLVAGGATRRSAGLHFPRGAVPETRAMAAESQRYYAQLVAERPELPIHGIGMTVVAAEASEAALHEAYLPEAGLRRLDGAAAAAALPEGAAVPEGMAAWTGDGCQYADVAALTQALAAELRPAAEFREGVAVTGVEPGADGVVLSLGTGDTITADRVVLAPGPWLAAPAWADLVAPLGARVKKIVALHLEQPVAAHDGAVVFHDEDAFLLPYRHRGHWLFSYTCPEWGVSPDAVDPALTAENRDQALEVLARYAPKLAARGVSGRVFCDAYGPGNVPQVRSLTDDGRVVFAGAASGSGYRFAPAIAAAAVRLLAGSAAPPVPSAAPSASPSTSSTAGVPRSERQNPT
ncbi:NAD(P)/FAD-dependent oxidoreductase [Yinghuangia soli]|uniref:FAD-binding oxidoreductase n=1 Tax=Yinghuangia soli TaxID=2908204 RepID=A0AA41Q017_9ACTN|nr:FAD-dependent oxidoreductase [Yinghuangia soli]MCF2528821.1 FAD-binding oxidoreductase [Yinghuangia soli]